MPNVYTRRHRTGAVIGVLLLLAGLAVAPPSATAIPRRAGCATAAQRPSHVGRFAGIVRPPRAISSRCPAASVSNAEPPYAGGYAPPLRNGGGTVLATESLGRSVTVTPIFWAPSPYAFAPGYVSLIDRFLADAAADSGRTTNVFSTLTQYAGSNGEVHYGVVAGDSITDAHAYPASVCALDPDLRSELTACLTDNQIRSETARVLAEQGLPTGLGHVYVVFTPRHVETCWYRGNPSYQGCSTNSTSSWAFCGFHSEFPAPGGSSDAIIYADMPYPSLGSSGYSCVPDVEGVKQAPNGSADADSNVSVFSHEVSEAITDPQPGTAPGWMDASGSENGDLCSYIYGRLSGSTGARYNQTINGHHYLAQEEFSNADYVPDAAGCIPDLAHRPTITAVSHTAGPNVGGSLMTITGSGFTPKSIVAFGTTIAYPDSVDSGTSLRVRTPYRAPGVVHVRVVTKGGTSRIQRSQDYTFLAAPTITRVSPASGRSTGGTRVVITGRHFAHPTRVTFGATKAAVLSGSATSLTVRAPAHRVGAVYVTVTALAGTSHRTSSAVFTFTR